MADYRDWARQRRAAYGRSLEDILAPQPEPQSPAERQRTPNTTPSPTPQPASGIVLSAPVAGPQISTHGIGITSHRSSPHTARRRVIDHRSNYVVRDDPENGDYYEQLLNRLPDLADAAGLPEPEIDAMRLVGPLRGAARNFWTPNTRYYTGATDRDNDGALEPHTRRRDHELDAEHRKQNYRM